MPSVYRIPFDCEVCGASHVAELKHYHKCRMCGKITSDLCCLRPASGGVCLACEDTDEVILKGNPYAYAPSGLLNASKRGSF